MEVSVGAGGKAKTLGTLGPGDVFGEMSLIDPGPRSATVRALTDVECCVASYEAFARLGAERAGAGGRADAAPSSAACAQTNERMARIDPGTGHRIQQWLNVILAGLDEQDALSAPEMESLQRELRMLLQIERFQIAAAEIDKAEEVLAYMLRPSIEECLSLWFGKFEADRPGDLEPLRRRRRPGVARDTTTTGRSNVEHPRLLVALVIMLDQFRRNMYRETAADVRLRRALPRPGQARAARRRRARACGRSSASSSASRSPTPRRSTTSICAWRNGAGRWTSSRRTTR